MRSLAIVTICFLTPTKAQQASQRVYYNNGWAITVGDKLAFKYGDSILLKELAWVYKHGTTHVIGTVTLRDSSFELDVPKAIAAGVIKRPRKEKKSVPRSTSATRSTVMIKLPFSLPEGVHSATMSILDSTGKMVETYHVTDHFSAILVAPGELAPGKYSYRLHTSDEDFGTQDFVVQ